MDWSLEAVFLDVFFDAVFLDAFFSFEDAFWEYSLEALAKAGAVARPKPSRIEAATAVNISFFELMTLFSPVVAVPTATTFHTEDERKMNSDNGSVYVALFAVPN